MKFFTNKKFLFKLIISVCLCLTLLQFNMAIVVQATTDTSLLTDVEEKIEVTSTPAVINHSEADPLAWGGQILQPIIDLVISLGDGVMNLIQGSIMGGSDAFISIYKARNISEIILGIFIGVCVIVILLLAWEFVFAAAAASSMAAAVTTWLSSHALLGAVATKLMAGLTTIAIVGSFAAGGFVGLASYSIMSDSTMPEVTVLPLINISPEEMFKGNILLFDVNFFNPKEVLQNEEGGYYYYIDDNGEEVITSAQSSAYILKKLVSRWYYTLRNVAMVILMVILIYIGIRILLTSVASEKAKYKVMIKDWLVAICLLFTMHYIMIFAIQLTENITNIINNSGIVKIVEIDNYKDKYEDTLNEAGLQSDNFIVEDEENAGFLGRATHCLMWPTNLMGRVRIEAQRQDGNPGYVGYALSYIVLVMYTVFFSFTYLKRLLYIAFLTIIAPLVAITYPIDKINDGKAQGFDIWLKEYIFNLLIQPLHLLLYTLLIVMAFELAGSNVLYSLVAIGFMMPAEKFLRKMFNFEKAQTPGLLSGAGGAALVMSGLNTLSRLGAGSKGKGKDGGNASEADRNRLNNRGFDSGLSFDNVMGDAQGENALPNPSNSNLQENLLDDERNPLADMLDVDGESIGNTEWNAQEYAANAADLHRNEFADENTPGMPQNIDEARAWGEELGYTGDELDQFLVDQGFGDEENDGQLDLIDDNQGDSSNEDDIDDSAIEQDDSDLTFWDKTKNEFKNMGKAGISGAKASYKHSMENIPGAIGTGIRVTGALTGAVIGAAAGIASGSPENVVKNTAGGVVAGNAIGKIPSTLAGKAEKRNAERKERFERQHYGTEYGKHKKEEADMMFKKDSEIRQKYAEELGINKKYKEEMIRAKEISDLKERREKVAEIKKQRKKEIDKTMEKAVDYRKFNVTNDDVIIKAMKIDKDKRNNDIASRDKIAAAMIATRAKTSKDVESHVERLRKQGVSENDANRIVKNAREINKDIV